jgi:phospholipid-translocating ATPase
LRVGNVVQIKENEYFPADLLILSSSGKEGLCYVETKNLDGENNLKHKKAPKMMNDHFASDPAKLSDLEWVISCEGPNKDIYKFDGTVTFDANGGI